MSRLHFAVTLDEDKYGVLFALARIASERHHEKRTASLREFKNERLASARFDRAGVD